MHLIKKYANIINYIVEFENKDNNWENPFLENKTRFNQG